MRLIHKYPVADRIALPADAEILKVEQQGGTGKNFIWALFDDEIGRDTEWREFKTFGTGVRIPDDTDAAEYRYVYTWQDSHYVWHLFEVIRFGSGVQTPEGQAALEATSTDISDDGDGEDAAT